MRKGKTEFLFLMTTAVLFFLLGKFFSSELPARSKVDFVEEQPILPDTSFYPFLKAELEQLYHKKTQNGFSGALLVSHGNRIVFEKYSSIKRKRIETIITPNSRYQLASISKQFTAVAILQLYEKGLLDLHDTVQKFIPDFPYSNITIHHLLCHRSGLPNYIYLLDQVAQSKYQPISGDSLLSILIAKKPIVYARPGRRFKYSNTGYVVLSLIVERITGQPFYHYLRDNVFEPAGMFQTELLAPGVNDNFPDMMMGYSRRWADNREDYLNGCYGDKGIWTTARYLFLWDQALYDTIILKKQTLDLAMQPHGAPITSKHNYGYGWRIFYFNRQPIYYHTGWWQGFKTLLMRFPEHEITVVVLKHTINGSMFFRDEFINIINRSFILTNPQHEDVEVDSTDVFDSAFEVES
jgi:CubicO group peptidase (beta-lactamase class C family)